MENYTKANRELWDEKTTIHGQSEYYDLKGFKAGKSSLRTVEVKEVGEVSGKSLLHLQCHFGLDTLSWARLGAKATGVDFSEKAIERARNLSRETGIEADFICADIYNLPDLLESEFDIVFTSYGVLCWLSDLKRWAEIIAHFLKPGSFFYIVEGHPILTIFDNSWGATEFKVAQSYFYKSEPIKWEPEGDYADRNATVIHPSYEWTHSLGEVVCALVDAGLRIDFLHELPFSEFQWSSFTRKGDDGWWHTEGDKVPMIFSIRATKT